MLKIALIRAFHLIILLSLFVVLLTLASCKSEVREEVSIDYEKSPPGTPIAKAGDKNMTQNTSQNITNATLVPGLETSISNISVNQSSSNSSAYRFKSNKRLTTASLDSLNLKASDLSGYVEEVPLQTFNLSDEKLKKFDGYGILLKEGHISTLYHDAISNVSKPSELIVATVIRYETDYIDVFIKNKTFDNRTYLRRFNASVGEYAVGYYTFDSKASYQAVYTIEFVKYDIWVQVIVASRDLLVKQKEVTDYARKIEARIKK